MDDGAWGAPTWFRRKEDGWMMAFGEYPHGSEEMVGERKA